MEAFIGKNPNEEKFFIADLILGENAPAYFKDLSGLDKAIQYIYGRVPGTRKRRRTMSNMEPTLNNLPVTLSSEEPVVLVAREYIHPEKSDEKLVCMAFSRVPSLSSDLMRNLSVSRGNKQILSVTIHSALWKGWVNDSPDRI